MTNTKLLRSRMSQKAQVRFWSRVERSDLPGLGNKRDGSDYNMPTQKAMELRLFKIKETAITHSDGHVSVSKTTKVTGRGQQYFINYFLNEKGGENAAD